MIKRIRIKRSLEEKRKEKDNKHRWYVRKKEAHRNALKTRMATQMTMLATPAVASDMVGQPRKIEKRMLACAKLSKLKNKSSYVKIRNRCVITGRSRGIYNYFKISRIMIRELASKGLLPGVKKATW